MSASLTTAQSIQGFYGSILARTGDAADVSYWSNQVDTVGFTLTQVQNDFATSAEALGNVRGLPALFGSDLRGGKLDTNVGRLAWRACPAVRLPRRGNRQGGPRQSEGRHHPRLVL